MSSLRKRWVLTCALLLLTLVAGGAAWKKLPPTYQSTSSIVFLVPQSTYKSYGNNPYLAFNSTLNQTADVVRYETNDVRTANSLKAQGYTSSYLVTDAIDTSGPVLVVTVTGHNAAQVEHTLHGVTTEVTARLEVLQAGIPGVNKISDLVITFTPQATLLKSKKLKPLLLFLALCVLLTISIPVAVDAQRARRAASQTARAGGTTPDASRPAHPRQYSSREPAQFTRGRPAEFPLERPAEFAEARSTEQAGQPYAPSLRHELRHPAARRTDSTGSTDPRASRQSGDTSRRSEQPARPAGDRPR